MTHFWAYHLFEQLLEVNGVQESPLQFYMVGAFFSNWLWTAGHLQSNSISDGYELTKLPFDLSFIKALLMHSKMTISIHIRLVNVLYCHPASLALIAT